MSRSWVFFPESLDPSQISQSPAFSYTSLKNRYKDTSIDHSSAQVDLSDVSMTDMCRIQLIFRRFLNYYNTRRKITSSLLHVILNLFSNVVIALGLSNLFANRSRAFDNSFEFSGEKTFCLHTAVYRFLIEIPFEQNMQVMFLLISTDILNKLISEYFEFHLSSRYMQ